MDVDIDQDDKLIVPIAKHGMAGFGVIVMLMKEIYKNGYFYPWTQKEIHVFPFKIHVDSEKVCEIIADCIESDFFSEDQMVRNNILTSYGFQKRFLLAASRRKESLIDPRFLVKKDENELMLTETELLHTLTPEMSAFSTQSKVKESKVNKIKLKDYILIIFSHWISKDLVKHKTITPHITNQITWKLGDYTAEELMNCITAYSEILYNPEYKLDTKWSLDGFLEKGHFEKFLPDRDPYTFYPKINNAIVPVKKSKLQKNKELLLGKGVNPSDGRRSEVPSVQSVSSLPEHRT